MVAFIVLGISADDIFVYYDAWQQSSAFPHIANDELKRVSYTFKRASRAMFVTSSTTAVAFLSNGFARLMPIQAFGFYSAIIVPVNFIMVVTFFPPIVLLHERHIKGKSCCFCCRRKKTLTSTAPVPVPESEKADESPEKLM
jgi:predicted RND superfamily exporter protein